MNLKPEWIWLSNPHPSIDVYAEFYDTFEYTGTSPVKMTISCDSNYAVYINGKLADCGQYPDFPYYKVYDVLNLTPLCKNGLNCLAVIVWHYGEANMSYYPGTPGLYYSIACSDEMLACSGTHVLSRLSHAYISGNGKRITGQLGFTFHYNACLEDSWMTGNGTGFTCSLVVPLPAPSIPRPLEKCIIGRSLENQQVRQDSNHLLVDLGSEQVGCLQIAVLSDVKQELVISYGEHIVDGDVRRIIDGRDFSVTVTVPAGKTSYMNPFRRLGARYLSLKSQHPIAVEQLTLVPVTYPVKRTESLSGLTCRQQRIYDVSVHTLLMCMHDHYEDSPWREQALYAMDGRNQIVCGYYAFREFRFARASLLLMAQDRRPDNLLSICTPSGNDLTIPSFSLHYFTEILEYTRYTGDLTLVETVFPKLESILGAFFGHMQDGALPIFTDKCHWNFYEWSDDLSGSLGSSETLRYDAALNCLFSLALRTMMQLCKVMRKPFEYYKNLHESINASINRLFYDEANSLYRNSTVDSNSSELVNAAAVLCGAADESVAARIAEQLVEQHSGMTECTLSMRCFKYDALLKVDAAKYRQYILDDISFRYEKMLDAGATAFWETELGEKDFHNAGSLCHGWSSMPVYYYHLFFDKNHPAPYYA